METTRALPADAVFRAKPLVKLGTGVDGLDEVLDGGFPKGRTTMIRGGPGAGKTLFALQYLVLSALKGTAGIFVTFEESADAIRMNAATLGWDLPALERMGLLFIHHAKLDSAAVVSGPFSLKGLMAIVDGKAKALGAHQLVIDAIDIVMRRFGEEARARDEINTLHEWLDENEFTTLLSVKLNDDPDLTSRFGFLDYMADCVIRLDHRVMEQISTRRLRVQKYRGSSFGTNEYPYVIGDNGISLVPIASAQLEHRGLGARQSTGNRELDAALGGGYRRNACVLIAGASGTGKTTLAATFVVAACARGERVLYISYEESPDALRTAVLNAGVDLQPALEAGNLKLVCRLPESMGSDEHLFHNLTVLTSFNPDHVVVDAISACHRMGSGKAAFDYCMRLVNACKERGITCLFTNQVRSANPSEDLSGLGFSSLVDAVIQLQFELVDDDLQRSLLIMKARGCRHSHRLHHLQITDDGILLSPGRSPAGAAPTETSERRPKTQGGAR
ncbi:MAG: circadian clock protein KaiC [Candidatus Latescibacteria bacterium]|nr:circadian clock protein KaiC [Candidatus Latescibacterota bacterium]